MEELRKRKNIDASKMEKVANILKVIGHPVRLSILEMLEEREPLSVTEIMEGTQVEQSLLSHHLTKMKDKGILESYRENKNIYYQLKDRQILKIFDCMDNCDLF